jgi:hypothetical protein
LLVERFSVWKELVGGFFEGKQNGKTKFFLPMGSRFIARSGRRD